jgi:hypothetical protein
MKSHPYGAILQATAMIPSYPQQITFHIPYVSEGYPTNIEQYAIHMTAEALKVFKYVTPCPWTNSSCHFTSGSYGDHSAFSFNWPWIWRHYNVPKCPELVTQWHSITTQMVSIIWNYLLWYQVIITWNNKLTDKHPTFSLSDKCTTTGCKANNCKSSKKYVGSSDLERHFIIKLEALTVVLVFRDVMPHHNWVTWPFRAVQSHPVVYHHVPDDLNP